MYSLDVNFLSDRGGPPKDSQRQVRRSGYASTSPTPIYIGLAVGLLLPLLAGGAWFWLNRQAQELTAQQTDLQTQIDGARVKLKEIENLSTQVQQANAEVDSLVAVFDKLRPWSAVLQDVSNRVPLNMRLATIKQEKVPVAIAGAPPSGTAAAPPTEDKDGVVLSGTAANYQDVNTFILKLKDSPFFDSKNILLRKAELITDPSKPEVVTAENSPIKVTPKERDVVSYEVVALLSDRPAPQMLKELEQLGATGLVARLEALQREGVIQP